MIIGLTSVSHTNWEDAEGRDWVCVTMAIAEASSWPPTTGQRLYGRSKGFPGWIILTPCESHLPCRLQNVMPYVRCELLQEFQHKIEMSTAKNQIVGNPDPPLGLVILWEGCRPRALPVVPPLPPHVPTPMWYPPVHHTWGAARRGRRGLACRDTRLI